MSLNALATGSLIADPIRRTSRKGGTFATAALRTATEDGAILVSVIAFGAQAEQLPSHRQRDALATPGRANLTTWTGRDGNEKHGVSLAAEQIASTAEAPRPDAGHRRAARAA